MIEQLVVPLTSHVAVKAIIATVIGFFAYFFDVGLYPAMLALFILSLMDLFTAFLARGENPTEPFSRPIRKTAHKLAGYFVSISSVFIVSNILIGSMSVDITAFDNILVGFFLIHEVISIIENLNKAGIPIPVPYLDKLKKVKELIENK